LLPFGFNTRWQRDELGKLFRTLWLPALISILTAAIAWFLLPKAGPLGIAAVAGGMWVMTSTVQFFRGKLRNGPQFWPSRGETGMCLAHFGVGLFVVGAGLTNPVSTEQHLRMSAGDRFEMAGYEFVFDGTRVVQGPNYVADEGEFLVYKKGQRVTTMYPQKRRYLRGGQVMTEAAIDPGLARDLYISMGEALDDQGSAWAVRIYHKRFIRFIWLGALLMMAGGFLAATDRRYRRPITQEATADSPDRNPNAVGAAIEQPA
jgi:cytochrome c-type biogenesis protein CcmF